MSESFPFTPAWAASIWCTDAWIYVDLPATKGHHRHTIKVPNSAEGIAKVLGLVRARTETTKIGDLGEPTQAQIDRGNLDRMVKAFKPKASKPMFDPALMTSAKDVLRKLGVIQ